MVLCEMLRVFGHAEILEPVDNLLHGTRVISPRSLERLLGCVYGWGKQLERRADALRNLPRGISGHWTSSSEAFVPAAKVKQRSGTISESAG